MLLTLLLVIPLLWLLLGMTLDAANARLAASEIKTALNRGVKAAVLALDEDYMAQGQICIEPFHSRENFEEVFCLNLGNLRETPEVLDFFICQGDTLPYVYNSELGFSHTFHDPGVLAVVKLKHKYIFTRQEQDIYISAAAEVQD